LPLAEDNFDEIRERIKYAYLIEEPVFEKLRKSAAQLRSEIKQIRPYSTNAVSFVSVDGGDNRLYFNPAVIEFVRIVDSKGIQCALDAIPGNATPESLNLRAEEGNPLLLPPLRRLCKDIGEGIKVTDLSYLLKGLGESGKSTGAMRAYRDIVEWAVLYDLMNKEWGSDTIIVREGLLRTKSFKRSIFPHIAEAIKGNCDQHKKKNVKVSIVCVAKQSSVLSRLAVALELEGVFHKPFPCYVKVPADIEAECYNFDRTWLDTIETPPDENGEHLYQSIGNLFLVKFGDRASDPVWPVDLAAWDLAESPRIMGQLLHDAQPGFPIPDFPMSIQKAHDLAKINGIEMSVLQDLLFEGIMLQFSPDEKEKIWRIRYLSENLTNRRYKNA
jgi:hypothetical protein